MPGSPLVAPFAFVALSAAAQAQFNDPWASFTPAPGALPSGASISDDDHETDLDWADLDLDGDIDLVIVRKQPFTTTGMRSNVLLVNEGGVLVDRTATLAAAADVPGDQGFLTPTNDRDVVLADLDGDGFPEVVTATEQTLGQAEHVYNPRVYLNLGGVGAAWAGLRYEDARIPQLFHHANGSALEPRFTAVDAGDLDGDGYLDLYFGDHDTGTNLFGATQHPSVDLDDRLLLNDGNGFFTDATTSTLQPSMAKSGFCNSVELVDINLDGAVDVVKQVSYQAPAVVSVAYNDPMSPGVFNQHVTGATGSPYFINSGDLNADGRLDLVVTQNDDDVVLINRGNLASGAVNWAAPQAVQFLTGGEPVGLFELSYSSNNLVADLDGDGWGDVLIADVDVEIPNYTPDFRLHLYHNQGGVPGQFDVDVVEERASVSDASWVGAHGLSVDDLRWTHDVAAFDVDGDGLTDLVLSRREGTQVWLQTAPPLCQTNLGFESVAGELVLEVCGGDLSTAADAELRLHAGAPSAATFVAVGTPSNPTPLVDLGVTVAPFPPLAVFAVATDADGGLAAPLTGGGGPATLVLQAFQLSATIVPLDASNAIEAQFLP